MFNLKKVNVQSVSVQSLTFKNSNETAINALLTQISLLFKFKIIKFQKIRAYKDQNENEYQWWFRDAKIKMINALKYFAIDKVKIF